MADEQEQQQHPKQRSYEVGGEFPPPRLVAAQRQTTAALYTTLGGLIAIVLGCLLMAIEVLTWIGIVLLIVTLILVFKARQNIVAYSYETGPEFPPPR